MVGNWRSAIGLAWLLGACGGGPAPTTAAAPGAETAPPASAAAATADPNVDAATGAAKSWLGLVDDEKYAESWAAAADAFQHAVTADDWAKAVGAVRHPLGKLVSRQVDAAEFKTSLPGAPDGKYVVVRFKTVFENKAQAIETVTPAQGADGSWKVSGYFVK